VLAVDGDPTAWLSELIKERQYIGFGIKQLEVVLNK